MLTIPESGFALSRGGLELEAGIPVVARIETRGPGHSHRRVERVGARGTVHVHGIARVRQLCLEAKEIVAVVPSPDGPKVIRLVTVGLFSVSRLHLHVVKAGGDGVPVPLDAPLDGKRERGLEGRLLRKYLLVVHVAVERAGVLVPREPDEVGLPKLGVLDEGVALALQPRLRGVAHHVLEQEGRAVGAAGALVGVAHVVLVLDAKGGNPLLPAARDVDLGVVAGAAAPERHAGLDDRVAGVVVKVVDGCQRRVDAVPADALRTPAHADEAVVLRLVPGVVVRPRPRIGVVLAVQGHGLRLAGVPANALVVPADPDQHVPLGRVHRVVVVASVGVVQPVDGDVRLAGGNPAHALIAPAKVHEVVALVGVGGVEVLPAVGVVQPLHADGAGVLRHRGGRKQEQACRRREEHLCEQPSHGSLSMHGGSLPLVLGYLQQKW